jgi:hypothetical protein
MERKVSRDRPNNFGAAWLQRMFTPGPTLTFLGVGFSAAVGRIADVSALQLVQERSILVVWFEFSAKHFVHRQIEVPIEFIAH